MLENFERHREREAQERREQGLRELAARCELKALRAQINPHFLFNALNTLADLTQSNPAAEKLILDLARVFHFALEATRSEMVPLVQEIEFIRSYLAVEQARFEEKLRYQIDVPEELHGCQVPPMLIQPLVENAVKHGISPRARGGELAIRVRLREGYLHVSVEDDGVGFDPSLLTEPQNGIGLSNVRERVERLSGPEHWRVESRPGGGTVVSFELRAGTSEDQVCAS